MVTADIDRCNSAYLALRYVPYPGVGWDSVTVPELPGADVEPLIPVRDAAGIITALREVTSPLATAGSVGILLSSGLDSAILAGMMPPRTRAYTVRFLAESAVDEVEGARAAAARFGLEHVTVPVTWGDYDRVMDSLMRRKRGALHPAEPGIYLAAAAAAADGIRTLVVGNGADSTFGGLDLLLGRDWSFDEFVSRYTFLEPGRALRRPVSVRDVFAPYRRGDGIDVSSFLKEVHGTGIIQMFENAVHAAGCRIVAPFERLCLDAPLDLERIRRGESKYLLREVFHTVCAGLPLPPKIAFARPMAAWLHSWSGPRRAELRDDLDLGSLTGEQRWLVYCLERFLHLLDRAWR